MKIEVCANDEFIILKNGPSSLWWPRSSPHPNENESERINFDPNLSNRPIKPKFKITNSSQTFRSKDIVCYGLVYGFVGQFNNDKLILIKKKLSIGRLPLGSCDEIFQIQNIVIIPLDCTRDFLIDLELDMCQTDSCCSPISSVPCFPQSQPAVQITLKDQFSNQSNLILSNSVQRTWNQIKLTASNVKPKVSSIITNVNQQQQPISKLIEDREKLDRRLNEEAIKMFNLTSSFYYSLTGDLTNSVQRQQKLRKLLVKSNSNDKSDVDMRSIPLWQRVDDRFFWNKHMLAPIIDIFTDNESLNLSKEKIQCYSPLWIVPIIQGFVRIEKCCFDLEENSPVGAINISDSNEKDQTINEISSNPNKDKILVDSFLETRDYYWMALISRRNRFRDGTRYKKRGLDENGKCANYVETEQIFSYGHHTVSFVCVRGSVPLFWSQPGFKYRPPPILERSEQENQKVFRSHFEEEFKIYGDNIVAINLIEQNGREKVLSDAYKHHVLQMNDPRLTYVTFDFHNYCRGMKFENVSILITKIYDLIKEMRYCWIDKDGVICEQKGTFRINCIDCLDRTNIVMTAIAKTVMDVQLVRLGLLPPEGQLSANSKRIFQLMWARNGDTISKQYAGTAALKGDYTRTGERKITGVVRDGYNSANRYYLNRFKDAYRQAAIDSMQGLPITDVLSSPQDRSPKKSITSNSLVGNDLEYHERIKMVIEDCKKILLPEDEVILGGWPLVDADPVTGTILTNAKSSNEIPECEMDIVLILTKDYYYVADYDDQTDRIVKYQKVALEDLEKIEIGAEPSYSNGPFRNQSFPISHAIRFHYTIGNQTGYFHMFRSTNTRFFNNMAIPIRTREEALESLKAVCESFKVALSVKSLNVPFLEISRLERRKSKRILLLSSFKSDKNDAFNRMKSLPSDNSYIINSKKLFTGVYTHFSRLRGKLTGTSSVGNQGSCSRQNSVVDGVTIQDQDFDCQKMEELECESDDDDSTSFGKQLKEKPLNDVRLSSDYSEGSEFGSEQILPPINEICSPCLDDEQIYFTDGNDKVLKSCGILATSPTLIKRSNTSDKSNISNLKTFKESFMSSSDYRQQQSKDSPEKRMKSIFHDVDDFVIESMKKASLRQIRKAASKSQISLNQTESAKQIKKTNEKNSNIRSMTMLMNPNEDCLYQSTIRKCFFNSELALNSIVSQPIIKSDLLTSSKFSSQGSLSDNKNAENQSITTTSKSDINCSMLSFPSSSLATLSYQDAENEFKSLGCESISGKQYDTYLDKNINANRENPSDFNKETSLSYSDLAFSANHGWLKTSLSSNTLQNSSEFMSLTLPPTASASNISDENDHKTVPNHHVTADNSSFTATFCVKKDLVMSPLTRITKDVSKNEIYSDRSNFDVSRTSSTFESKRDEILNRTNIIEI
ncbi:Phosphatidylinositide phosphatase SAC2 [Sarcoptes scabiei]|uniref:Phosphatidylinositide phosphatase SAC2 n=1 Tax=Sarcoptes scabiei TaxID=52283 RepID=A0A834R8X3_SARSC|nr:Phosphatidylinositide phosphatase SAC2 [Sarcoptes scabiei]